MLRSIRQLYPRCRTARTGGSEQALRSTRTLCRLSYTDHVSISPEGDFIRLQWQSLNAELSALRPPVNDQHISFQLIKINNPWLPEAQNTNRNQRPSEREVMKIHNAFTTIILTAGLFAQPAFSQDQDRDQQRVHQDTQQQSKQMKQVQNRKQVYGSELMTEQERNEHREKLRNMNSEQEREAYRTQHHEEMTQRAREQGVELSDDVPRKNQGKGKAQGAGYSSDSEMGGSRSGGASKGK